MKDKKSVYIAELQIFYCCGEYSDDGDRKIIGVYSTADKAEIAGRDELLKHFTYDAETGNIL